jgi:branched-chain amino acid transport system ATP-binding protein
MSLRLHGLRASYGRHQVLHGIDLVVPPGSTVALLGPNGAGKTSLLQAAAGFVTTTAGTVSLDGVDITSEPAHRRARRGLCLIPEGRGIFPPLTVRENLAMHQRGRRRNRDTIDLALSHFPRLSERLDQLAGTMSGGEQQMLAMARAFVTRPRVVLADELSFGLAPRIVDDIFAALDTLTRSGTSILLVEQYVDRAIDAADYVYLLHKGRIVLVAEPGQCRSTEIFSQYVGGSTAASPTETAVVPAVP